MAPFFAGRAEEIGRFEEALRELRNRTTPQAVFRIYQGAPGSGKTSLLHHLRETFAERALFVRLGEASLASATDLLEAVGGSAARRSSSARRVAADLMSDAGAFMRLRRTADRLASILAEEKIERVVLHLDEAQTVGPAEHPGLLALHRDGIGVPAVCLLVGLSHTANRIRSLGGMSRLADNAVVDMGAMSEDDCAESTRAMLDAVDADGDRERAARAVARMSFGWPQHLKSAQKALCRELLRVAGDLDRGNFGRVRSESDEARFRHYRDRLSGSVLGYDEAFTAAVVAEVRRRDETWPAELVALCDRGLATVKREFSLFRGVSGEDFANALIEKSALSWTPDGRCEVAIPSVADWLATKLERRRAPGNGTRRPRLAERAKPEKDCVASEVDPPPGDCERPSRRDLPGPPSASDERWQHVDGDPGLTTRLATVGSQLSG